MDYSCICRSVVRTLNQSITPVWCVDSRAYIYIYIYIHIYMFDDLGIDDDLLAVTLIYQILMCCCRARGVLGLRETARTTRGDYSDW